MGVEKSIVTQPRDNLVVLLFYPSAHSPQIDRRIGKQTELPPRCLPPTAKRCMLHVAHCCSASVCLFVCTSIHIDGYMHALVIMFVSCRPLLVQCSTRPPAGRQLVQLPARTWRGGQLADSRLAARKDRRRNPPPLEMHPPPATSASTAGPPLPLSPH